MSEKNTPPLSTANPYKYVSPAKYDQQQHAPNGERRLNKQLSEKNSWINNMTEEQLTGTLKYHNLDVSGSLDILRKRLKVYMRKQLTARNTGNPVQSSDSFYSYYLIIDFEATCEDYNSPEFKHEIIEFPIILYDTVLQKTVDTFHAYCRPVVNPTLSDFCRELTNIDQPTVNSAQPFPEVFRQVEEWMGKHRLYEHKFVVVCDCNADMAKFMRLQCAISGLPMPTWAREWINLRKVYRNFYQIHQEVKLSMQKMLTCLGLEFEGRQHTGLHDAQNILRIVEALLRDGCEPRVNEKLDLSTPPHFTASVTRREAESSGSSAAYQTCTTNYYYQGGHGDPGGADTWHNSPPVDMPADEGQLLTHGTIASEHSNYPSEHPSNVLF